MGMALAHEASSEVPTLLSVMSVSGRTSSCF